MAGKRIAYDDMGGVPKKKSGSKAGWIVLGVIAAALIGGAAGLGFYANNYERVFPGVTLGERSLAGYSKTELENYLSSDSLLSGQVSVTADGENLGQRTQRELGAYIDSQKLADAAWAVGREEGAAGWFKNGWTMLTGLLGGRVRSDMVV